jgi:hypothetical protein
VAEVVVFNAIMGCGFSIKFVLPNILSVLTHLFNFVIASSSFSTAWKTAIVLPLPISGGFSSY